MSVLMEMAEPLLGALYPRTYHQNRLDVLLQERRDLMVPVLHMHKAVRVTAGGPYEGLRVTRIVNEEGLIETTGGMGYRKGWAYPGGVLVFSSSHHRLSFRASSFVSAARVYGYHVTPEGCAQLEAGESLLMLSPEPEPEQRMMLTIDETLARCLNRVGFHRRGFSFEKYVSSIESFPVCVGDVLVITTKNGDTFYDVFSAAYAAERLRPVALN